MEYTETNKLIAEFMGLHQNKDPYEQDMWFNSENHLVHNGLKYHTSWDWLMPVVEKIESMGYKFQMCRRRVTIKTDTNEIELFDTKGHSKLDAVYQSVSKFIQWYNSIP